MDKQLIKDLRFLRMADEFSKASEAKRNKVGCILVNDKGRIVSTGYNGTPSGVTNRCEDENDITYPFVIHAEINAIFNATTSDLDDATAYVSVSPCINCAAALLQKKVKRVCYSRQYRKLDGLLFLEQHGVEVNYIQPK